VIVRASATRSARTASQLTLPTGLARAGACVRTETAIACSSADPQRKNREPADPPHRPRARRRVRAHGDGDRAAGSHQL